MALKREGEPGAGILMASRSWLEWCGLGDSDIMWQQPKHVLHGPLTKNASLAIMPDMFTGYSFNIPLADVPMTFLNTVHYRWIWTGYGGDLTDSSDSSYSDDDVEDSRSDDKSMHDCFSYSYLNPELNRAPFRCTLNMRRLQSDISHTEYPILEVDMEDEKDLTASEVHRLLTHESMLAFQRAYN
jgi:hypothetical protein